MQLLVSVMKELKWGDTAESGCWMAPWNRAVKTYQWGGFPYSQLKLNGAKDSALLDLGKSFQTEDTAHAKALRKNKPGLFKKQKDFQHGRSVEKKGNRGKRWGWRED